MARNANSQKQDFTQLPGFKMDKFIGTIGRSSKVLTLVNLERQIIKWSPETI
jgi:hypothetical protein